MANSRLLYAKQMRLRKRGIYLASAKSKQRRGGQPRPAFRPHLLARQAWQLERVTKTFRCHAHEYFNIKLRILHYMQRKESFRLCF